MRSTATEPPLRETPAPYTGPVVVDVRDIIPPATFTRLPDALEALRTSLRALPLGDAEQANLDEFLAPDKAERIAQQLGRTELVCGLVFIGTDAHPLYIRTANAPRAGSDTEPADAS